jgi:hypothetical protein
VGPVVVRLWRVIGDVIVQVERMKIVGASGVNMRLILYIFLRNYYIFVKMTYLN